MNFKKIAAAFGALTLSLGMTACSSDDPTGDLTVQLKCETTAGYIPCHEASYGVDATFRVFVGDSEVTRSSADLAASGSYITIYGLKEGAYNFDAYVYDAAGEIVYENKGTGVLDILDVYADMNNEYTISLDYNDLYTPPTPPRHTGDLNLILSNIDALGLYNVAMDTVWAYVYDANDAVVCQYSKRYGQMQKVQGMAYIPCPDLDAGYYGYEIYVTDSNYSGSDPHKDGTHVVAYNVSLSEDYLLEVSANEINNYDVDLVTK